MGRCKSLVLNELRGGAGPRPVTRLFSTSYDVRFLFTHKAGCFSVHVKKIFHFSLQDICRFASVDEHGNSHFVIREADHRSFAFSLWDAQVKE
jgi:hypothetical protein